MTRGEQLELSIVIDVLNLPRDRLGRIDVMKDPEGHKKRELLRSLAIKYNAPPCRDILDQCAKVLQALLNRYGTHV